MIYIKYSKLGTIIEAIPSGSNIGGTPYNTLILENKDLGDLPSDLMENYYVDNNSLTLKTSEPINIFCSQEFIELGTYKGNAIIRGLPEELCELRVNNILYQVEEGMVGFPLPIELVDVSAGGLVVSLAGKHRSNILNICIDTLPKLKDIKYERVKVMREQIERAGAPTSKGLVDITGLSLSKIQLTAQRAILSEDNSFSVEWTMFDNSKVMHNKQEFIALSLAVSEHINSIQAKKEELKSQIISSTNITELNSIAIDINWPGQPVVDPILNLFGISS